jgi:predicted DCC family thiol-disulfide oxidoreductase YuxK
MTEKTTVLYNGACPICNREIEHYRGLDLAGGEALDFADISESHPVLEKAKLSEDAAKRRLHVIDAEGRLLSGIPAFAAIWAHLPRYRWLSVLARWPVLKSLLPWVYEPIAYGLYRWDKRRQARRLDAASS